MLEIAESNGETGDNGVGLAAAVPAIGVAGPAAAAPAVPVAAAPPRLAAAAPPRRGARRAAGGRAAGGASWSDRMKGVLGELVDLMAEKF
jgi:hypothetical protein